ncbi:MAG: hypothetical protein V3U87_02890 [Methylococcaceae bacterium]
MIEEKQEKDNFVLYVALVAIVAIGVILMIKKTETDKFAPIKERVNEEITQMNIRVLKNY